MLIQNADLQFVHLPLSIPLRTPHGRLAEFRSLILSLTSSAGTGKAEVPITLFPDEDFEYLAGVIDEKILPLLKGQSFSDTQLLREKLGKWSRHAIIYPLVEMAWYDLQAQEKNKPLCQILGAEPISQQVFTSLDEPEMDRDGIPDANEFLDRIQKLYRAGYVHLELKIRPGWDVAMVREVRQENPGASFHIDFEGALTPLNYDILFRMRDFFPFMFEQPFAPDELVEDAELQKMLQCPLCLDESISTPGKAAAALKLESTKLVKINPMRAGGFERAKEILEICREEGVNCWISSPLSTGVAVRANLAFSCLNGFTGPFEYYDLMEYFTPEVLKDVEMPPELALDEEQTLRIE
ncbi:MAG: enolase C-terminal domain-like protein [Thermoguttaceae bacterium]|nr:enolase C-terminal domain-like protein [Thermoguttaceae bacterium]